MKSNKSTFKTSTRNMPVKEGQVDKHIPPAETIEKVGKELGRSLGEDLPPQTWANVAATGLSPSPNRPDIYRSDTSSKSAKRMEEELKPKQLYEKFSAKLPVLLNPFIFPGPVRDLPTEDKSERNENPSSTADIATRAKVSRKVFEDFKTLAATTRLEKARKGREERLDELRAFSESFNLHAPIPSDLLPILSKDPTKQRHIQAKALKDAKPLLESYEPSLEDAKRSVG